MGTRDRHESGGAVASVMLPETSSVKGQWADGRLNELQGAGQRAQVGIKDVNKIREKSVRRDKQSTSC